MSDINFLNGRNLAESVRIFDKLHRSGGLMVNTLDPGARGPGARFSKVPKSFRTQKAMAKSQTFDYRAVLFTYS